LFLLLALLSLGTLLSICALRLGALRLGTLRLGALRLGTLRLGTLRLGTLRLGALRLGTLRLGTLVALLRVGMLLAFRFSVLVFVLAVAKFFMLLSVRIESLSLSDIGSSSFSESVFSLNEGGALILGSNEDVFILGSNEEGIVTLLAPVFHLYEILPSLTS
jgi:hypothetical protein